jgi:hypothetical protein
VFAVLAVSVASCGGSSSDQDKAEKAKDSMIVLRREDPEVKQPESGETKPAPPVEAAVSREEAARRARLAQARTALEKATNSDDRAEALTALQGFGPAAKDMWDLIVAALKDEEPYTRGQALITAASVDPQRARSLVEAGMDDPIAETRRMALSAFEKGGYPDTEVIILRQRDEIDGQVQLAAMLVAERLGDEKLKPSVLAVLGSLTPPAAAAAVRYLAKIKAVDAADAMTPLLTQGTPEMRSTVIRSLEELKVTTKPVLLSIADCLMDDDITVRRAANTALESLTGDEYGFTPEGTEEERRKERDAWKAYINSRT